MLLKKILKICCLSIVVHLLWIKNALAWGPGVHTVIALNMIENASLLLPSIAGIISAFPIEYMYGCLAADFFMGKSRMKKAAQAHNWKGGFTFLKEAGDDREAAYAYGFLSHLAADVVAHNFFVPHMTTEHRSFRKKSHLYWELRADYQVGPEYTRIARSVLAMDHSGCDDLLKMISGKRRRGLEARKMIFRQSVRISDRAYATHHLFFPEKMGLKRRSHEYASFMVGLSAHVVKDLLKYPESSPCLVQSPLGRKIRGSAEQESYMSSFLDDYSPFESFHTDQEYHVGR